MKIPAWLVVLHQRWKTTRGGRLEPSRVAFSRLWEDLLDEAGLKSAAERSVAATEAAAFENDGQKLKLKRHKYRDYIIERVSIPLNKESWLTELFGETSNVDLLQQSRLILQRWQIRPHERWPESWQQWLRRLDMAFSEGKNVRPLSWQQPEMLDRMLKIVHGLTSCEWTHFV